VRAAGNPGGPGHQWVKARFIDPAPGGYEPIMDDAGPWERMFIPSRVQDNRVLMRADPFYVDRLRGSGSPEIVRAWLEGDWSIVAGAYFPEWDSARHVIEPRALPESWLRFRSFDWGSAKPFSVGWWAVSDGELAAFPRGAIIRYREWYGMSPGRPNVGLKMTAEEVADGIKQREVGDKITYGVADPSIFATDGGPSIRERMKLRDIAWRAADNKRVAQAGAMGGWDAMRARLKGEDDRPMLYVFNTCRDFIRTVPALQHDPARSEDVDTSAEDHAADECFVASTLVQTATGPRPIASIRVGDLVDTRSGLMPVSAVFSVGERDVFSVKMSDGNALTGTANHPIWVEGQGFIPLSELRYGDMMRPCQSPSSAAQSRNFVANATTSAASIFSVAASASIGSFGRLTTAVFHAARISTIATWIRQTISPTTSFAFAPMSICHSTGACAPASRPFIWQSTRDQAQLSGMVPERGLNGTDSNMSGIAGPRSSLPRSASLVTSAAWLSWVAHLVNFVLMPASRLTAGLCAPMMLSGGASDVGCHSSAINSNRPDIARTPAPVLEAMKGWSRNIRATIAGARFKRPSSEPSGVLTVVGEPTPAGLQRVYNLSVEGAEEYFASGVLVHNCRYACMSRPWVPVIKKPEPEKVIYYPPNHPGPWMAI